MNEIIQQPSIELGAHVHGQTTTFTVWAPRVKRVAVHIEAGPNTTPRAVAMTPSSNGYHKATIDGVRAGTRYRYVLDGERARPDPVSRFQPEGVHGPSEVVDREGFLWADQQWRGLTQDRLILYELHVGTFTGEGTFQAIIPRLEYLKHLGITAIELMPVAQFPGVRNWGYDGVGLYAPQSTYGGPRGLKELVNACHLAGIAVVLDVVYNHLGPEGNYLEEFGPYFTDRYRTPWGRAINYDGPDSDEVRRFIIHNALSWVTDYHLDGLRLDAIHGIYDFGARHVLQELADTVHAEATRSGRTIHVIAESDLNDARVIAPVELGGHGLDGQWSDDFHHALHTVLTGEHKGYYEDFGTLEQLAAAYEQGFVYDGHYSRHRRRRHGNSPRQRPPSQLVVYAQNHDQVGNRALGERLSRLVPDEALKVAAATVLLSPFTPLLFMGEEYGETAPFQYFIDHGDRDLIEAVRRGRREEFSAFDWTEVPDPDAAETFARSRPVFPDTETPLFRWYTRLIQCRKTIPALGPATNPGPSCRVRPHQDQQALVIHRPGPDERDALIVLSFNKSETLLALTEPHGRWNLLLSSHEPTRMPAELHIAAAGVKLPLPSYAVAVFLNK